MAQIIVTIMLLPAGKQYTMQETLTVWIAEEEGFEPPVPIA